MDPRIFWHYDPHREIVPYYLKDREKMQFALLPDRRHTNYTSKIIHGAILTSLADTTMCIATAYVTGYFCCTQELTCKYVKPSTLGKELVCTPTVVSKTERSVQMSFRIEQEGILICQGSGTIHLLPNAKM